MKTYPIILAHGIARFDVVRDEVLKKYPRLEDLISDRTHYFRNIKSYLKERDFDVHHASVAFAANVAERAEGLRAEVEAVLSATGQPKAHIIAHSMGGLDARYMIARLGMAEKIASLTTIGTPHMGTSFADWGIAQGGADFVAMLGRLGINFDGFLDLTTDSCRRLNDELRVDEGANNVVYQAGASKEDEAGAVFFILLRSWEVIKKDDEEHGVKDGNDGLVPYASQLWEAELPRAGGAPKRVRRIMFPVPADHLNQVGWWEPGQMSSKVRFFRDPLLWLKNLLTGRRAYEKKIKDVYLGIAENLAREFADEFGRAQSGTPAAV